MNKLLLVFDYFKEAFHLNKQNKSLYAPQIALIIVKVLLIVFAGIGVYSWIGVENINALISMQPGEIFRFILSQGLKVLALILLYSLISVVIESGLLNMYKKAVVQGYLDGGDFREGVSKYFIRLLVGQLLIAICYVLASPFYLIIGLVTLTVGLTVIPILAGIFLTMWKVSLVMNDKGIFEAVGDSFRFARRNFIPLTFLQIIHWAFLHGINGKGSANFNFPGSSQNTTDNSFFGQPDFQEGLLQFIRIFKVVVAVLIPVAALATIGASIIGMILEVFFSLALFIAYKNDFYIQEPIQEPAASEDPATPVIEETESINDMSIEASDNEEVEQ